MNLMLSWSGGSGGGHSSDPTWDQVSTRLAALVWGAGTVTLEKMDEPAVGPQHLQVRAEQGQYVITLGVDTGDDWLVKTYNSLSNDDSPVDILGDLWDSCSVCKDFGVVVRVFEEFFESGDIASDILV